MITVDGAPFLTRKEVAEILHVSVQTLEVWRSVNRYATLHKTFFKFKGRTAYYKESDVLEHFKAWDPIGYELHCRKLSEDLE